MKIGNNLWPNNLPLYTNLSTRKVHDLSRKAAEKAAFFGPLQLLYTSDQNYPLIYPHYPQKTQFIFEKAIPCFIFSLSTDL